MKRPIKNLGARVLDAIARNGIHALVGFDPALLELAACGPIVAIRYAGAFAGVAMFAQADGETGAKMLDLCPWFERLLAGQPIPAQTSARGVR